jgi:hypothetical protein
MNNPSQTKKNYDHGAGWFGVILRKKHLSKDIALGGQ